VPVAVKIGAMVSNFATISISPDGSVCSDPTSWSVSDLQNGAPMNVADVGLGRVVGNFSVPGLGTAQGPSTLRAVTSSVSRGRPSAFSLPAPA
jgi:hypothetical protein